MSDTSLQRDVMQALADNQLVFPDEISAQVVGNDVTLRGTVGSVQQRDEAGAAQVRVTRGFARPQSNMRDDHAAGAELRLGGAGSNIHLAISRVPS